MSIQILVSQIITRINAQKYMDKSNFYRLLFDYTR